MQWVKHYVVEVGEVTIFMEFQGLPHHIVVAGGEGLRLLPGHALGLQSEVVVGGHVAVVGAEGSRLPPSSLVTRELSVLVFTMAETDVARVFRAVVLLS